MRVAIVNLGCKVNRVEADTLAAQLECAGCILDDASPDFVVINSCTVTGEADKKTRKAIRRALREHPHASVVVTGCAVAVDHQGLASIDERVVCAGIGRVPEVLGLSEKSGQDEPDAASRFGAGWRTRAGIKVQDGCDNACTFCIVHVARGPAWSRPFDECLAEAQALAQAGAHEVVLTGINLGCYESEGRRLHDLVRAMRQLAPEVRVRLSSIEPNNVEEPLIDLLASSEGWVCRHLHMPVQSGSTTVLSNMGRPYSASAYRDLVKRLYERVPGLSLSTDVIVGFPGETEDDFRQTLDLVEECCFTKVHAFRYSKRVGTPAASRTDQVRPDVVARRYGQLANLADRLRDVQGALRVGTWERVLVEDDGWGTSESYYPVQVGDSHRRGELALLKLASWGKDKAFHL